MCCCVFYEVICQSDCLSVSKTQNLFYGFEHISACSSSAIKTLILSIIVRMSSQSIGYPSWLFSDSTLTAGKCEYDGVVCLNMAWLYILQWENKRNIYKIHLDLFLKHLNLFSHFDKCYFLLIFEQDFFIFSTMKVRSAIKLPAPQMTKSRIKMFSIEKNKNYLKWKIK